jgi:hypothetical protein
MYQSKAMEKEGRRELWGGGDFQQRGLSSLKVRKERL